MYNNMYNNNKHMYVTTTEIGATNLRKSKAVYGKGWREEKEGGNDVIIFQFKELKLIYKCPHNFINILLILFFWGTPTSVLSEN